MNEIYNAIAGFLEELRCDSEEREYAIQTEDMKVAENQLKEKSKKFEQFLSSLSEPAGKQIEEYLAAVDTAHFKEEQRAYYQGIMDGIQILGELGLIKKSANVDFLLRWIKR